MHVCGTIVPIHSPDMKALPALLGFVVATLTAAAAPIPGNIPAADRIVVLISVDGLAHYYFDDPKAEMPMIRKLAAGGARARTMTASMPTVTWPNHTTLVTGVHPAKHSVIGNNFFSREKNAIVPLIPDPYFNKEEIVKSPTIYDAAKDAGLKTAAIIWPASRGGRTGCGRSRRRASTSASSTGTAAARAVGPRSTRSRGGGA